MQGDERRDLCRLRIGKRKGIKVIRKNLLHFDASRYTAYIAPDDIRTDATQVINQSILAFAEYRYGSDAEGNVTSKVIYHKTFQASKDRVFPHMEVRKPGTGKL